MSVQAERPVEVPIAPLSFLSFQEVFWAGLSQVIQCVIFVGVSAAYVADFTCDLDDDEMDSEDELTTFHDAVARERVSLLFCVAFTYLSVAFGMVNIYCIKRVFESLFGSVISRMDHPNVVPFLKWIYIIAGIIAMTLMSLFSVFLFLGSYYSWEFVDTDDDTSYTGYYIQFMLIRAADATVDCAVLWMGMMTSIPWIVWLYFDSEGIKLFLCNIGCNKLCLNILLSLWILIVWFGTLCTAFDWAASGFWSVAGVSGDLGMVIFGSMIVFGGLLVLISCRMEKINDLIRASNTNIEYVKLDTY